MKIILSRTDNLGDVILTLPMAGVLKQHFPGVHIVFLGKSYTRPLIDACEFVDEFLNWDELKQMLDAGSWMLDPSSILYPPSSVFLLNHFLRYI